jgi:two-component system chemotaxis response regulator CheB
MMVLIGGSLGGCEALRHILLKLPANFSLPIAVVLHRQWDSTGLLEPVVQRGCPLPVHEVVDRMPIEPGHVYIAPADYHLYLEGDHFALSTDDLVNYARPSLDAFFVSAAEWLGREAIAVVLTGGGSDGAAGAKKIMDRGGLVLVQDPKTADGLWMPAAAIAATKTPHVLTLDQIAERLIALSSR